MKINYLLYTFPFIVFLSCKEEKKNTVSTTPQETIQVEKTDSLVAARMDSTQVPKALKYKGNFKDGFRWKDQTGEYIVVTSETGIYRNENFPHENDDSADAEVFAQCYSLKNNQLMWKVNDFVKDCIVDIDAEFKKNTLGVTDLDKNGIAEIWVMYEIACKGDISPSDLKIIMYEGKQKFAMRGEAKIRTGMENHSKPIFEGGSYTFDKAFQQGPKAFRDYAEKLWNNHMEH